MFGRRFGRYRNASVVEHKAEETKTSCLQELYLTVPLKGMYIVQYTSGYTYFLG